MIDSQQSWSTKLICFTSHSQSRVSNVGSLIFQLSPFILQQTIVNNIFQIIYALKLFFRSEEISEVEPNFEHYIDSEQERSLKNLHRYYEGYCKYYFDFKDQIL